MLVVEKTNGQARSAENIKSHPALIFAGSQSYLTIPLQKPNYESYEYDAINLTTGEFFIS